MSRSDRDKALDGLAAEYPCWQFWKGVNGQYYGRLPKSSPPVVFRADDAAGVAAEIEAWRAGQQ